MTAAPETRVGWCPGARRPMPSRDGFIVRVKPRGATLSLHQATGIAAAARTFGNGALDLTSRANLQIRGASDASLPALTEALDRLGLLDPDLGAEARRNVMMSPLAGFDPEAWLDIRPVVAALEDRLTADAGLAALPAKFGFAVSDGGRLRLGNVGADVTFDAGGIANLRRTSGFAVRLAGDTQTFALCPAQSVPDVAARLAGWFVAARTADPDLRRMRHAVARLGAAAILAAIGLRPERWSHPQPSWPGSSRPPTPRDAAPGHHDGGAETCHVFGVAAPFADPQPSWPGSSRPPTPADIARGGEMGWGFGVGHFALRAGVGGRDKPGHDDGGAETCHVLGVAAPSADPQPSWPGSSRPPTPRDVARGGETGWGFGVGHVDLRAGVGGRDKPGHDDHGAETCHVLGVAAPSANPQPSWPGSSRPPTSADAALGGESGWGFGVGHFALRAGVGGRDEPGHDDGGAETCHVLGVAAPSADPQPSWPGSSRPPTPTDVAPGGENGWGFGVGHFALRAGVGGWDKPGHDDGGAEICHVLGAAAPSADPQPSWPGSSRPPTPTDAARGGETGWGFGVGHVDLRAGVGGRDKPGHDDHGAETCHVLGVAAPSANPQPSWPGSSRPPTPRDVAPGHDDGGAETCHVLGVASASADPQPSWPGSSRPPTPRDVAPGHDDGGAETCHVLGVAAPFGRLDAAQLDALARGALEAGACELRLTPWRTILVPGLTRPAAEDLAAACVAVGLVLDPADPRLRVAACPGAPGCHRGTTPVLDHAARWAALLGPGHVDDGIVLHVSGCAKGCAHPATAPLTLVAENGRYRLVTGGLPGPAGLDADAVRARLEAASQSRPT